MARNATIAGNGITGLGKATGLAAYQAQNLAFQINDVVTGLASGQAPMRVFAQQGGQFFQIFQQSGLGVRGFVTSLLEMIGVLKVTRDAELAEEAANAAAAAAAVKGAAQRAAANIAAADTELALSHAAIKTATTTEALEAAQARLAKAHIAVAAASAEAATAETALAEAQARAATAAEASAAKTATSIGLLGRALGVTAVVAGTAFAALKLFQSELNDQAPANAFIASLGLTHKEMKKLKDTTVTTGDIFTGLWKTIAARTGVDKSIADFRSFMIRAFSDALKGAGRAMADIYGEVVGTYRAIGKVWDGLPAMFAATFARAVNAAAEKLEGFINGAIGGVNAFTAKINGILGVNLFGTIGTIALPRLQGAFGKSFGNIGGIIKGEIKSATAEAQGFINGFVDDVARYAIEARNARVRAQAEDIIGDRSEKAAKAHRDRAKAANDEADALERLHRILEHLMFKPMDVSNDLQNAKPLSSLGGPDFNDILGTMKSAFDPDTLLAGPNALLATLQQIADQAQATAQVMQDSFGNVGGVFGSLISNIADYGVAQQQLAIDVLKGNKTQEQADKALSTIRAHNTAAALSGLKSLFKEHSAGYKVMTAIEKAYAIFQAVQTAIAIARDIGLTTTHVANSATRTAANTAEGGSKIFAQLGWLAFPVVAAMLAVLASLGAKGGGGGAGSAPVSADDLQESAGTGTVLGDAKAKSASIANSLEIVAANTNKDLEYSNAMLQALRNIDTSIAKMAGTVARQISVSGSLFDTSKLRLGTSGSNGFLGLIGGSTTTRSLFDLGIQLTATTVGNIIANGIAGSTYQIVEKIKKSNGFLGIGGGTSTSYITSKGQIDPAITQAIQDVIKSLRDGLVAAADVLGLAGAQAILDSFNVSLGKISFKDMTGKEIEDQLNAIFSSIGDQMAAKLLPSLKSMQKVGEGLFETFIRVAKEYEAVDIALKSIGRTFGAIGVNSIAARDALVQLFGGLDQFIESTDFFRDQFLTEAEQIAPVQASVIAELQRLGVSGITTRDQFKQLVLGLDLTTDAGRQMYASLLAVAPAFDKVLDYFEQLNKTTIQSLQSTVDQFTKFADSLKKYRDTLFATDTAQGNAYATLRARFIATANLAATGDATALGGLEQSGKDFLTAAKNNASSLQDYYRDVALVARGVDKGIFAAESTADYAQLQLDALKNAVTILGTISANTASTAAALGAPVAAPVSTPVTSTAQTPQTAQVSADIQQLRTDINAALIAIATNTGSMDRTLNRVVEADAVKITTAPGDSVDVNLEGFGGKVGG
jgi:hypothetical protein